MTTIHVQTLEFRFYFNIWIPFFVFFGFYFSLNILKVSLSKLRKCMEPTKQKNKVWTNHQPGSKFCFRRCVLYILTRVLLQRTPNTGWNSHFQHFLQKSWKMQKSNKLRANYFLCCTKTQHQNTDRLFYSPQKNSFFSKKKQALTYEKLWITAYLMNLHVLNLKMRKINQKTHNYLKFTSQQVNSSKRFKTA